jgi:uncharacterized protein
VKIYIDADACPRVAKDVLYKTSERLELELILVANQYIRTPPMPHIRNVVVGEGADVADDKIVEMVEAGDLVITSDIPLADRIVKKEAFALSPRGELFDEDNIAHRLAMRDLMEDLRNSGMETGGPAAYSKQDRQEFVNVLDRFLVKQLKK